MNPNKPVQALEEIRIQSQCCQRPHSINFFFLYHLSLLVTCPLLQLLQCQRILELLNCATSWLGRTTYVKNSALFWAKYANLEIPPIGQGLFPNKERTAHFPTWHNGRLPWVSVLEALKFNKAFPSQSTFQEKSQIQDISAVPVRTTVAMGMGRGGAVLRHFMISSQPSPCWDRSACWDSYRGWSAGPSRGSAGSLCTRARGHDLFNVYWVALMSLPGLTDKHRNSDFIITSGSCFQSSFLGGL